jgi:hypothetical protein
MGVSKSYVGEWAIETGRAKVMISGTTGGQWDAVPITVLGDDGQAGGGQKRVEPGGVEEAQSAVVDLGIGQAGVV